MADLVIERGTVVNSDQVTSMDIGITEGTITELAEAGELDATDADRIDAEGQYVFPGFIDSHVHAKLSLGEHTTVDGFADLTRAAALGGTTTIIPFAIPDPEESPLDAFERRLREAKDDAYVDYGFHGCITDCDEGTLDYVSRLVDRGAASIKTFMVYKGRLKLDDGDLREVMAAVADSGGILLVHAENDSVITHVIDQHVADDDADYSVHGETHPPVSETSAMWTVAEFVAETGCPTLLVHTSSRGTRNVLQNRRDRDLPLIAETCPHYLVLTDEVYDRADGERFVCSPPIRSSEHRTALWKMIEDRHVTVVNSDHCGYTISQKREYRDDVTQIPNGLPGVETCHPILYSEGVAEGRISLRQFVELSATNVAKAFGLYPKKGTITIGADADLVVFDPSRSWTVDGSELGMASDYSPFDGIEVTGTPDTVLCRGKPIVKDRELVGDPEHGQFVSTSGDGAAERFRSLQK